MDNIKQQILDRIKQSNNVLVTVSNNPSVDQLAACIGLTLMLNKLGKHGTAVFSGQVPPIMEFLQPEKTIEKNTNSLRDFIIALDKSKADKLRYKVEDKVVKIFITPYRTSISEKDLLFSEGDFNVDAVVTLGVHNQTELDQAITAHGRILHDAAVISINDTPNGQLGSLNLFDQAASSLSEVVASMSDQLGAGTLDPQIATALLTGIVARTERFSNKRTSSQTMAVSSKLLAAGANQQLVATKLAPPPPPPPPPPRLASNGNAPGQPPAGPGKTPPPPKKDDGTLKIDHGDKPSGGSDNIKDENNLEEEAQIHIDEEGNLQQIDAKSQPQSASPGKQPPAELPKKEPPKEETPSFPPVIPLPSAQTPSGQKPKEASVINATDMDVTGGSPLMTQPPTWDSQLTANTEPDSYEQGLERNVDQLDGPTLPPQPPLPQIKKDIEGGLSEEGSKAPAADLDDARNAVNAAVNDATPSLQPRADLGAQEGIEGLQSNASGSASAPSPLIKPINQPQPLEDTPPNDGTPAPTLTMLMPGAASGNGGGPVSTSTSAVYEPTKNNDDEDTPSGAPPANNDDFTAGAPPPVPPPMTPPML